MLYVRHEMWRMSQITRKGKFMKQIILIVTLIFSVCAFSNETAVAFVKQNEGFRSKVYMCTAGKPTIGYGFTEKTLIERGVITETAADRVLRMYVASCQTVVYRNVKVKLTENQEAVLIDFVYHFGSKAFYDSTLLKKLNAGKYDQVPHELRRWVNQKTIVKGKVKYVPVKGLVNRANRRIALWNKK